jgi:cation-transporting P-type ATPase E
MIEDRPRLRQERLTGLTSAEAAARAAAGQANAVSWETSRTFRRIVFDNAATPINIVLFTISAMLLALALFGDALLTAGLVLGNVLAGVVQETRAKRQLDRIALLNRPRALVIRDGREAEVTPEEIVLGDYVVVHPGDQVLVDGTLVAANGLGVDESFVTGESDIRQKQAGEQVISGSFCMAGSGVLEATRVGGQTTANQITARAREHRTPRTPLQREVGLVLWVMSLVVVFLGIAVARSFQETTGDIPLHDTVRAAAVIVALVPQGLAVMVTVSYAMAAVRMAGTGVLIQRMNAVESISHVDVLCLDKTGTLTTNRLTLEGLKPYGLRETELQRLLGIFAASASFRNRTADAIQESFRQEPLGARDEVAFDSARKWSGLVFADEGMRGAYVLGAPEVVMRNADGPSTVEQDAELWAERGLRVLLFARSARPAPFSRREGEPALPEDLAPLGLVILRDETRPDAASVVSEFAQSGIGLKVISGDHPDTVAALASQAGLPTVGTPVSGGAIDEMSDKELERLVTEATIFGRVSPRSKERIIGALRRRGKYVAMVGDGVNDVPALKAAQVAVALRSGSGVTRNIADMVLLSDAFSNLPRTFREGQRIRKGMENIFRVFLTRTLSLTLLILVISLLNDPFPVTPRHTAIIALLTVGIPSLFLAVWAKPGRTGRLVILSGAEFVVPAAIGIALVGLVVYEFYLSTSADVELARTALTLTSILCGLILILFLEPPTRAFAAANPLSGDWRPAALALGLFLLFITFLVTPFTREFFELVLPDAWGFAVIGLIVFSWAVVLQAVWRMDIGGALRRLLRRSPTASS